MRSTFVMADSTTDDTSGERPPLGSWAKVYTLCCVLAVIVMALLYWFSSHFNVRMLG